MDQNHVIFLDDYGDSEPNEPAAPMHFWTHSDDLKKSPSFNDAGRFNQIHSKCDFHQISTCSNRQFCDFLDML